MGIFTKVNRIFDKSTKIKLVLLMIAISVSGLLETFALAVIYTLTDVLINDKSIYDNVYIGWIADFFNFNSRSSELAFLAFASAIVYGFRGVYVFVLDRTSSYFLSRKQAELNKRLLNRLLGFSYLYHTHKNIAEIIQIIISDVTELFVFISTIMHFLIDFFMTFFMMTLLFYESPVMTACVLALALICAAVYFLVFRKQISKASKINRKVSISINKAVYQLFGGIKEVKISQKESYFKKVYAKSRDKQVKALVRYKILSHIPKFSIELIFFSGAFLLMGFFIVAGTDMSAYISQLALFVLAAFKILPAITGQITGITRIIYARVSVDAVHRNLFEETDIAAGIPEHEDDKYNIPADASSGIEVCNVSFAYPRTPEAVLENVSFTIPENKSVAFVGPSGVGKTTLADLILGLLTPNAGTVRYKGQSIYSNPKWSSTLGYIPQQIYLLDESILENVAFGIEKSDIDENKVWKALEQAQLKEFVETLPDGLRTIIGDRGIRLSGGQRQRVGIARAIYGDPPILVLDEATSSLDTETETAVMEAIKGFHGNKTILIIAHRLSTIEHCDIVYRVEGKKVTRER